MHMCKVYNVNHKIFSGEESIPLVGMGSSRYKVCRCIPGAAREELGFWSLQGAQCIPDHAVKKLIQVGRTKRLFRPVGNRERHADTGVGGAAKFSLRAIWVHGLERVYPAVDLFAFAAGVAASPRFLKRLALPFIDTDKAAVCQNKLDLGSDQRVKRSSGVRGHVFLVNQKEQVIHRLVEESGEQFVLARKVSVDGGAGDSHLLPNVVQRNIVKAAIEKQVGRRIKNLFVSFHSFSFSHWYMPYV